MAEKVVSKVAIELDIAQSDKVMRSIDDIERGFKSIQDASKSADLSKGLEEASAQAESLAEEIKKVANSNEDSTKQIQAYSKAANRAVSDLQKQSTKLSYSLTDQGKKQRENLATLRNELATLGNSKKEQQRRKEIEKEITAIEKDVVDLSDDALQAALKQNREIRAKIKLSQSEAKLLEAQKKNTKTLGSLVKADLKTMGERLKSQLKFIDALKTTEGRYNAIKKAASAAGKAALTIGKGAAKVGASVVGGALALGGAAIASANSQVDREREAQRIKVGGSMEEKQDLLGRLYIQTGADYTSIVDAINRVQTVLGSSSVKEIEQAAAAEIRMPGAAALFMQQNTGAASANDFTKYMNRMKAVQSATGASVDQITNSTDFISNIRQSSFSNASMTDLQTLYLTMQNSGMYGSEDELQNAFKRFVREQKNSKKSVFDFARDYDFSKGIYDAQNKTQAQNAMQNIDWGKVETASKESSTDVKMSEAEKTAMKMREMEETKNKILMKVLEAIYPIIEKLDISALQGIFNGLIDLVSKVVPPLIKILNAISPYIEQLVTFLSDTIGKIVDVVEALIQWIANSDIAQFFMGKASNNSADSALPGQPRANGGLVTMPSLVGEKGPEWVLPLDYSRSARAGNIIQNLTQNFAMAGNETTTLSLMQAMKSRDYSRAMASNSFINRRLGR